MAPKNNERFAAIVRDEFVRLGITQAEFQARGGPSDTTLRRIIEGQEVGVSPRTLSGLDSAFKWERGSAARSLAGGDPTPLAQTISGVGVQPERHQARFNVDVAPSVTMTTRQSGGLGRGLKYLIPTADGMSPEEREKALEDERAVLESTWSAATEITESVLESNPSDRLRAATQRVVFLLSAQVITRILGSGYAPALESWLERVYRERQILHERLGDSPTPWVQDGRSPEDAARSAVQTFGQWPRHFQPQSSGQGSEDQEASDDLKRAAADAAPAFSDAALDESG